MTNIRRQFSNLTLHSLLALALLYSGNALLADEGAVDPEDDIAEVVPDTTDDPGPRSVEVAAPVAEKPAPAESNGLDGLDGLDGSDGSDGSDDSTELDEPDQATVPLADAVSTAGSLTSPLQLLGETVMPGTTQRLSWSATELFEGVPVSTPILVIHGALPGPTLCLTAAVHGDELNGIEMVRRVMHDLEPGKVSGSIIGVPIVNVQGFRRGERYLPDRRDLNRYFPGNPSGSAAARIAHSFFINVIAKCDALIDLHTGSNDRANLPQIRADLRDPDVVTMTQGFGSMVILHSTPTVGTLRYAATRAGIPTVTLEAGGPSQLELNEVRHGVKGIETLVHSLGMIKRKRSWGDPEPVYYRSSWVRANNGGILLADVSLGSTVRKGDLLGTITDPMSNARSELRSSYSGRIIGMARNQVVMPGFAAFHIGIEADETPTEEAPTLEEDEVVLSQDPSSRYDDLDGISEEE